MAGVAHAGINESPSGSGAAFHNIRIRHWTRLGYVVTETPSDGQKHAQDGPCGVCTANEAHPTECWCWPCREERYIPPLDLDED